MDRKVMTSLSEIRKFPLACVTILDLHGELMRNNCRGSEPAPGTKLRMDVPSFDKYSRRLGERIRILNLPQRVPYRIRNIDLELFFSNAYF